MHLKFDFDDCLEHLKMMRRMGPLEKILGMIPGMDKMKDVNIDEKQMKRTEAIMLSMTFNERAKPDILNARRRQRIAAGSGTTVTEVNELISRYFQSWNGPGEDGMDGPGAFPTSRGPRSGPPLSGRAGHSSFDRGGVADDPQ